MFLGKREFMSPAEALNSCQPTTQDPLLEESFRLATFGQLAGLMHRDVGGF